MMVTNWALADYNGPLEGASPKCTTFLWQVWGIFNGRLRGIIPRGRRAIFKSEMCLCESVVHSNR